MKPKMLKWFEVFIESVNYIIINYALSNMAMLFQNNLLYILFFASEIWVMGGYWRRIYEMTTSKLVSVMLMLGCFAVHIGMIYFVGCVVGTVIPFKK